MKRILIAALAASAAFTPVLASAQSAGEVRQSQRDVRRSQAEVQQGRAEVRGDIRRGDYAEAREDRREVREDRRDLRENRQELREDWRDYRRTNKQVFQRNQYRGPSGYRYRPVTVGYRFAPSYYGSRYVIANPGTYRLPRTNRYQRWVRYGNDVALVNIRNGRVLQVYNRFFW